jgi:hypothetical protein
MCKDRFTQDKRRLTCKATYCPLRTTTEFRFVISHVGNATADSVRMLLSYSAADSIEHFCFCVDEQVKCDPLQIDERTARTSVSCTWSYINPRNDLELMVSISN